MTLLQTLKSHSNSPSKELHTWLWGHILLCKFVNFLIDWQDFPSHVSILIVSTIKKRRIQFDIRSYNVVGHFKFSCVLVGGYLLFDQPVVFWNLVGVFVTITGIILYTHFKLQQTTQGSISSTKKVEDIGKCQWRIYSPPIIRLSFSFKRNREPAKEMRVLSHHDYKTKSSIDLVHCAIRIINFYLIE